MYGQTFAWGDLPVIGLLFILEGLLSADNALVLAIMVRHLDGSKQKKALNLGLGMSFAFRVIAILLATWVIRLWWLQLIGAAYLLFLPVKHFLHRGPEGKERPRSKAGFAATVVALGVTDVAFAVDSVLAAVATVPQHDKLWIVIVGALLGVVSLRFASKAFLVLLAKYPALDHVAYLLVGWAGVKLLFLSGHTFEEAVPGVIPFVIPELPALVFWGGLGLIAAVGALVAFKNPEKPMESRD